MAQRRSRTTMHKQAEAYKDSKKPFDIEKEFSKQSKKKPKTPPKTPAVAKSKKRVKTRTDLHKPYRPFDMHKAFGVKKEPFDMEKAFGIGKDKGGVIRKKTGGHIVDSYDY